MDNKAVKNVFINLHDDIVQGINPDPIIDSLLSKNVITTDDYCELREVQNPRSRCRDLLKLLYRCTHPETFVQLRIALRDQYPWIVDEIDRQLTPHAQLPQRLEETTTNGTQPFNQSKIFILFIYIGLRSDKLLK